MFCQDGVETNLIQLFAHIENSEWCSTISVTTFKASIVAEHVNSKKMSIMGVRLHWTQANSFELVARQNVTTPTDVTMRTILYPSCSLQPILGYAYILSLCRE